MSNSRALVIKSIKQGETSSMVSCYLEEIGYKSFLVKGLYSSKKSSSSVLLIKFDNGVKNDENT